MFPYLTSIEKQIIEVRQGLAQIISITVRPPSSYKSYKSLQFTALGIHARP